MPTKKRRGEMKKLIIAVVMIIISFGSCHFSIGEAASGESILILFLGFSTFVIACVFIGSYCKDEELKGEKW